MAPIEESSSLLDGREDPDDPFIAIEEGQGIGGPAPAIRGKYFASTRQEVEGGYVMGQEPMAEGLAEASNKVLVDVAEGARIAKEIVRQRPFDAESTDSWCFELQHGQLLLICAYSPTGHLLSFSGLGGSLRVLSTSSWQTIEKVDHEGDIHALCFSPCGRFLSFGGANRKLSTLCTESWNTSGVIELEGIVYTCAYSPDSNLLSVGGGNKIVTTVDTSSWTTVKEFHLDGIPLVIAFSPKGDLLSFGGAGQTLTVASTASWDIVHTVKLAGALYKCVWSAGGELLSFGGEDRMITTVSTADWQVVDQSSLD